MDPKVRKTDDGNSGSTIRNLVILRESDAMLSTKRLYVILTVGAVGAAGLWLARPGVAETKKPNDAAVERTREQVRMLDDLYKTAVVYITEKYVHKDTDVSAGTAAVALFGVMKQKGWHDVRLVDATGQPFEEKNLPKDEFEKSAIEAFKKGKAWQEEVVQIDGQPFLRAATPVPVVHKKCAICHPHFDDVKAGQPIGIISYVVPVK